jgi:hypothetical protein
LRRLQGPAPLPLTDPAIQDAQVPVHLPRALAVMRDHQDGHLQADALEHRGDPATSGGGRHAPGAEIEILAQVESAQDETALAAPDAARFVIAQDAEVRAVEALAATIELLQQRATLRKVVVRQPSAP